MSTAPAAASTSWQIDVGGKSTTAVLERAEGAQSSGVFVCAHGAGGHMSDRGMLQVTNVLRSIGLDVVRFNFLYREHGSRRPDPMPILKATISAVVSRARQELAPRTVIVGGRSMGGRAASMLAADGLDCSGLLLLAYPLHPAGKPEQLRDAHLPAIKVPVLCFSGTRDALCRRDLMENALSTVTTDWTMHWIESADHSFRVLKSSGRRDPDVLAEIAAVSRSWISDKLKA